MVFFNKFIGGSTAGQDNQDLQSIIDNLNNMLNTKKGYGSFLKGYGIRDMNEYSSREYLATAIMDEFTGNIEHYEPRLELVSISLEDNNDPFRISFTIECRVKETAQSLLMEFDSVYNEFSIRNR